MEACIKIALFAVFVFPAACLGIYIIREIMYHKKLRKIREDLLDSSEEKTLRIRELKKQLVEAQANTQCLLENQKHNHFLQLEAVLDVIGTNPDSEFGGASCPIVNAEERLELHDKLVSQQERLAEA